MFAVVLERRANAATITLKQCRRAEALHEVDITGLFDVENTSSKTLLLSKTIDLVRTLVAASSPDDLKNKQYTFVMSQEFGANRNISRPKLEEFTVLKPGEKTRVAIEIVAPLATNQSTSTDRLHPGTYWMQFEFASIPSSMTVGKEDLSAWQKRWKSKGLLLNEYFLTEPFHVDVLTDMGASKCDSD